MRLSDTVLCALVLGALIPRPALAQEAATPAEIWQAKAGARSLADHGYELFAAGRHAEALTAFRRADRLYHAPTILLMVARSYERIGKLLEAQWTYEVVVTEKLDPWAPRVFRDAQKTASAELAELNVRIPALQIFITGAAPASVKLSVDGAAIAPDAGPIPKDPGRSVVVARIIGRPPVERVVTLKEGRVERLTLDFTPPPAAPTPGSLLPAGIALGAAGLGLGVGVVTLTMASAKRDSLPSRCARDGLCAASDQLRADNAQTLTTASTVGFVAGSLATVAGVTLLVLRPGGGAPGAPKDAAVRVVAGPGSAQVAGRF